MSVTPQCLSCGRFVDPAKCNHYVERGDYGIEYECERCAAARPYDAPPKVERAA